MGLGILCEKVRQDEYQFDESLLKPYFELDNVLKNGVFFTMKKLYGIEFRERHDLPTYHPMSVPSMSLTKVESRSDSSMPITSSEIPSVEALGWMRSYRSRVC